MHKTFLKEEDMWKWFFALRIMASAIALLYYVASFFSAVGFMVVILVGMTWWVERCNAYNGEGRCNRVASKYVHFWDDHSGMLYCHQHYREEIQKTQGDF